LKRTIKIIAIAPLILLILVIGILSVRYSPVYIYRLVTQNVADVYDYKYYENRTIKGSDSVFTFYKYTDEAFVEDLFYNRISRSGFMDFDEWAEKSQTTALIFIRKDTILFEKYYNGFNRDSYFHSQSMAKSFISFLIGAAIDDGFLAGEDDPMTDYIPELLERDTRFGKITIKHLLEMRSGLKYNTSFIPGTNIHAPWHDEAIGYYHPNVRRLLLKKVKIETEPGGDFMYCNYNTSFLGLIIERATNKTVSEYLEEKLWSKTMEFDALFSLDSEKSGFEYMPSRLMARAIDYARFGRLFLKEGNWNGNQIISRHWVESSTREDKSMPRSIYPSWFGDSCKNVYYSYHWWGHANCDSTFQFAASGNLGQTIYVIPGQEIIIVHCGNSLEHYGDNDLWQVAEELKGHGESRAEPAGYED
jgi:CubicO group peptidase (beta-lactamase class C family)